MERFLKLGAGCLALLAGGGWLVCGIYADLVRDGYGGVLLSVVFYAFWIWLGGYCFASAGVAGGQIRKWVVALWFLGYLYLLLRFTLFEPAYDRQIRFLWSVSSGERRKYLNQNINLIPLASLKLFWRAMCCGYLPYSVCLANLMGNLAVFAPMPVFLRIFRGQKNPCFEVPITAAVVFLVEILQILTMCGSADVDDLLLNMAGAAVSSCFVKRFWRKLRRK